MNTITITTALVLSAVCVLPPAGAFAQVEEDILKERDVIIRKETRQLADAAAEAHREVERNMKDVERQVRIAQAHAGAMGPALKRAFGAGVASLAEAPLIISTKSLEPAVLAELREDLAVLGKLVNDALADNRDEAGVHRAMGIVVNLLPGHGGNDNLYIEGHGVILQTTVRFPLAPAKKEETTKPAEAPKNSAWDTARRELFGGANEEEILFMPDRREEYDADRVESLQKSLVQSLANASNFRHLGQEETVTVVVRGGGGPRSQLFVFKSQDGVGKGQSSRNGDSASTMTIRIRKSDADALAAGKITEEEFRQRAKVAIY